MSLKLYAITNEDDSRIRVFYQQGTNQYDALGGFLDQWEDFIDKVGTIEGAEDDRKKSRLWREIWNEARGLDTKKFVAKEIKVEGYKISVLEK